MALPLAISSRMRTSIRTADAGTRTVSSGAGPIRNCSGSAAPIWEARTRLVSLARIASASEGSAGASVASAIAISYIPLDEITTYSKQTQASVSFEGDGRCYQPGYLFRKGTATGSRARADEF